MRLHFNTKNLYQTGMVVAVLKCLCRSALSLKSKVHKNKIIYVCSFLCCKASFMALPNSFSLQWFYALSVVLYRPPWRNIYLYIIYIYIKFDFNHSFQNNNAYYISSKHSVGAFIHSICTYWSQQYSTFFTIQLPQNQRSILYSHNFQVKVNEQMLHESQSTRYNINFCIVLCSYHKIICWA